jgi:NTP pyrophosphatase (non-canonical NTP hydrolase)
MTFEEYQNEASKTAIYPETYKVIYPALGLTGEAGEVAEKVKKWVRDGTLDREGVKKELGDVMWYLAALATDLNVSLNEIANANIEKLRSRQARQKLSGSGDDR